MACCDVCGKSRLKGHKISITRSQVSRRARKFWKPNVHKVRILVKGSLVKVNMCTKCMRIKKMAQ
jgi:large subunit ribosomal protein L28